MIGFYFWLMPEVRPLLEAAGSVLSRRVVTRRKDDLRNRFCIGNNLDGFAPQIFVGNGDLTISQPDDSGEISNIDNLAFDFVHADHLNVVSRLKALGDIEKYPAEQITGCALQRQDDGSREDTGAEKELAQNVWCHHTGHHKDNHKPVAELHCAQQHGLATGAGTGTLKRTLQSSAQWAVEQIRDGEKEHADQQVDADGHEFVFEAGQVGGLEAREYLTGQTPTLGKQAKTYERDEDSHRAEARLESGKHIGS
jgi:hypothetical protein